MLAKEASPLYICCPNHIGNSTKTEYKPLKIKLNALVNCLISHIGNEMKTEYKVFPINEKILPKKLTNAVPMFDSTDHVASTVALRNPFIIFIIFPRILFPSNVTSPMMSPANPSTI